MSIASLQHPHSPVDHDLPPSLAWKHELRARLREHQQRRGGAMLPAHTPGSHAASRSSSRVAERVAQRYRDAPSYRELLAASAGAAAAAAIAAQHAVDAAHLAHAALSRWQVDWPVDQPTDRLMDQPMDQPTDRLMDRQVELVERDAVQGDMPQESLDGPRPSYGSLDRSRQAASESNLLLSPGTFPLGLDQQVRTHAPLPVRSTPPARNLLSGRTHPPASLVDAFAEAVVPAAQALPAKLIKFPRELIAPRKQRPRLAEGPLLHAQDPQTRSDSQAHGAALRIFEVADVAGEVANVVAGPEAGPGAGLHSPYSADAASTPDIPGIMEPGEPERARMASSKYRMQTQSENGSAEEKQRGFKAGRSQVPGTQSGWAAIHLGEHPDVHSVEDPGKHLDSSQPAVMQPAAARLPEHGYAAESLPALHNLAPVSDRFMAALVDGAIVSSCFLLAVLVFASCTVHPPVGREATVVAALVFCALATFYGWLFMSYGGGSTPGMRYARIALCTFSDENPRRRDLQNRVPATALSLLPLGLGAFWALLDQDKLGWHDRMTRTYQRSYR